MLSLSLLVDHNRPATKLLGFLPCEIPLSGRYGQCSAQEYMPHVCLNGMGKAHQLALQHIEILHPGRRKKVKGHEHLCQFVVARSGLFACDSACKGYYFAHDPNNLYSARLVIGSAFYMSNSVLYNATFSRSSYVHDERRSELPWRL